jgi:hypothetical protein
VARKIRWFRHVMRITEERWPAIIHSWIPLETWWGHVTEAMEKGGWGKLMSRTRYFGEEDWEGGGQPYKPIYTHIYIYMFQEYNTHN